MRTLYHHGQVYTPRPRDASAVMIEDDKITWIGTDDEAAGLAFDGPAVDLAGALMTPAFVDAHVHLTGVGLALGELDLAGAATLAEALARVERAARSSRGRPLIGGGWDETTWPERRAPSAAELDRASYGGSVYLARVDAHSAVVSSALLAAVPGLSALTGYRRDGRLTLDAHHAVRTAALSVLGRGRTAELHGLALRHAASLGLACVHEMAGPAISGADDLAAALSREDADRLPEVIGYWGELLGIDTARDLGAVGAAGDLFCDGSLGSRTAALHEPYLDAPGTNGTLSMDVGAVAEHIARCERAGMQAGFHAIGDAAVDQVIEASELARARTGAGGPAAPPHRVEHAEFVTDPVRLARTGLIASVQPGFDAAWGGPDGMYAQRLGAERAASLNRFGDLAAAGVPLAFGSDAPVTPLGPWHGVRAAVRQRSGAGLDVRAAFGAHTRGGWAAAGRSGEGELRVGRPATFAVWDARADVTGLPAIDAATPTCLRTVRNGMIIHDADAL